MKQIPLSQGKFAIVDDADYDWLMQWKWSYQAQGYASRRTKEPDSSPRPTIYMHRVLCEPPEGMQVDHINRNRLDNRRSNLRPATISQQRANRQSHGSSSYLGVSWFKQTQKWKAQIKINGKQTHIGYFDQEEEAAQAYIAVAQKVHGEFCYNYSDKDKTQ